MIIIELIGVLLGFALLAVMFLLPFALLRWLWRAGSRK